MSTQQQQQQKNQKTEERPLIKTFIQTKKIVEYYFTFWLTVLIKILPVKNCQVPGLTRMMPNACNPNDKEAKTG